MATTLVENLSAQKLKGEQPVDLFTGDDFEITDSYQDICNPINVKGQKSLILWINYDRGDSTGMQIKALVGASEDACEYSFAIETVSDDKVDVNGEVIEAPDSDIKFVRQYVLDGSVNFIKFQVKDDADGTGQLDSVKISIGL